MISSDEKVVRLHPETCQENDSHAHTVFNAMQLLIDTEKQRDVLLCAAREVRQAIAMKRAERNKIYGQLDEVEKLRDRAINVLKNLEISRQSG